MPLFQRKTTEFDKFHQFLISGGINPPQDDIPDDNNNNKIILSIIAVSYALFRMKRYFR